MTPRSGFPEPLGVALTPDGANVAVYSRDAERIELCLFDAAGVETRIVLPARTGDVHHGFFPGLAAGQLYGFRAHGPWRPEEGLRFNPAKLLIDPYATRIVRPEGLGSAMQGRGAEGFDDLVPDLEDTAALVPKCVMEAPAAVDPARPPAPRPAVPVIYELHVKGFTATHPAIPQAIRGTFAGLAHPAAIDHLVRLGVTVVELMPVAAWLDERHLPALGLSNYWGYNQLCYMAPDPRLAPGGMAEVAAAVDALHRAGIAVILDVVFNHTAESDERGQTLSLRGLDNRTYYRLAENPRFYVNDTGCGHTLALDRPAPMRLALDALRYWALVGGVDGFRFDLAPVLGRTAAGFDPDAPFFAAIEQDPVLRDRIMIAEPWDVGPGGYRLGDFPARWQEWNDTYRDDVRRFWRGDAGIGALATRLAGSSDIFEARHRQPAASVNFVAAHDGFSLADVVAYSGKHNEANGEGNRDGHSGEIAWNNGAEGSSDDGAVRLRRAQDVRALLATLLLSRGTPMLSMGDEIGRTQHGNNNTYAQDNPITWMDWERADPELFVFTAGLVAARRALPALTENRFLTGEADAGGIADVVWLGEHGRALTEAEWTDGRRHLGMLLAAGEPPRQRALVWINAGRDPLSVLLPEARLGCWRLLSGAGEAGGGDAALYGSFDRAEVPARSVCVFAEERGRARARSGDVEPAFLDRLAELAGIAPDWSSIGGARTLVSPETKRALLDGMGLPCATMAQARESHDRLIELAAAPLPPADEARCFVPAALADGGRRFGISTQLYTLRRSGDQGVGDFTTLSDFAAAAAARDAAVVALNPLHAMFPSARDRASPYQPSDRRFLDPAYVDLAGVPEIDAASAELAEQAAEIARLAQSRFVDWPAVWRLKRAVLECCYEAMLTRPARREAVARFRAGQGAALERFALFQALEEEHGGTQFRIVPPDTVEMDPTRRRAVDLAVYLQFLADEQLEKASHSGLAVGLYRDLAVGAASDGAEVWSEPGAFMSGVSVGAPPDPFSALGQNWFIPPLSPIALRASDFAHLRQLFRANMRHAGALRIDHVMALSRLFVIPAGASPSQGAYLRYPVDSMLRVLAEESRRARCLVIGEDLGTVEDGFRERMGEASVFSYRVLFFERDGIVFRPPEAYPAKAVACVATHDLPTLRGWWSGADIALDRALGRQPPEGAEAARTEDKRSLAVVVGDTGEGDLSPELDGEIHAFLASSPSALVLAQAEDMAAEIDPVNVPGTDREYPNWRRRLDVPAADLLETPDAKAILAAMAREGRMGAMEEEPGADRTGEV